MGGKGSLSGTCNARNTCEYDPVLALANCDSAWDPKNLVSCDRNTDCPKGLGWETACHRMLSPTPTGQSGYCVPSACESEIQCPSLGDECQDGSISGRCNLATSTCDYNSALAIATCVSY